MIGRVSSFDETCHYSRTASIQGKKSPKLTPNYKNVYGGKTETDNSHCDKLLLVVEKFAMTTPVSVLVESNLGSKEE